MGNTWVMDLRHLTNEQGAIPPHLPGPARKLVEYLGSIVAAASEPLRGETTAVVVQCRRRPGRRRCLGVLHYGIQADTRVVWECPECGDNGFIAHWEGTAWDRTPISQVH